MRNGEHPEEYLASLLQQMDQQLGDVPLTLTTELAQTKLSFAELLNLEVGDIIKCSRSTGENVDIFAEDTLIGWGEVLMIDGVLTVRIADIRNARLPDMDDAMRSDKETVTGEMTHAVAR